MGRNLQMVRNGGKKGGAGKGVGEQKGDRDRSPKILDASPALHWVLEVSSRKERHED